MKLLSRGSSPGAPKKGGRGKQQTAKPARPEVDPEDDDRLQTLRDGMPVSTGWGLLVGFTAVASYVGYILQDGDNVSGAVFADVVIGLLGVWVLWWIGFVTWLCDRIPWEPLQQIPEPLHIRDVKISGADAVAEYRRTATARINSLIEQLIYDYGLLLTGQEPPLDYASEHVRTVLLQAVAPVLRAGDRVRPDFGNHVDISIDWHPGAIGQPVTATAVFIDASTKISASGMGVKQPERKMRIIAAFDHQFSSIIEASLTAAP